MALLELGFAILALLFLLYKWATLKYSRFKERGVPYEKPWPLVGNAGPMILNKESLQKLLINFYRRNKSHKIVGYFNFREPHYIVNDPDLIKKITVKDFDHFPNHIPFLNAENDALLSGMLSIMKDQRWKDMRNTLSPAFTASKMRAMFSLMNECFDESLKSLRGKVNNENEFDIELKECFTRLSNDIIASTAFGLKVNSYVDGNNEFYTIGQAITNVKGKQLLRFMFSNVAPWLSNLLGVRVFDANITEYFMRLVIDAMKYREENKIVRPDMIQLLLEAKKESSQQWSNEDLVAQCFIFFFAAFENNANLICTTCHELMDNPDIQQRLYEECIEIKNELNGAALNYDVMTKMKYMDMVVSESLRKWVLAPITDRICKKDYTLTDDEGNTVFEFKTGDLIWIPLVGIQWDEKYFEHPEIFDPERFSEENKSNIKPFTYAPFGMGPRICIGNRYALMQAKAMLYYLVSNFKLERSSKTVNNLLDDARGFQLNPPSGFWMHFVPR